MKIYFLKVGILFAIFNLFISCKSPKTSIELLPENKAVGGDLEGYLQVAEGPCKVELTGNELVFALKFQVIKAAPEGKNIEDLYAQILDENGLPIAGVEKFYASKTSKDEIDNIKNALRKGSGVLAVLLTYHNSNNQKIKDVFNLISKKGKKFLINSKIQENSISEVFEEKNIKNYPDPIQTENIVKVIRQHYYRINDQAKQIQPVRKNFQEGYINAYILDGNLLRADVFYNTGKPTEHYYFNDNNLIFMYNDGSQVNRYYFNGDLMIRWLDPAKNEVPKTHPNYSTMERLLLDNSENFKQILGITYSEVDYPPEEDEYLSQAQDKSESIECDKFLKEYREFAESYIKMIVKYKNNPNDLTILNEYTTMMEKAARLDQMALNMKSRCDHPKYWKEVNDIQNKIYSALKKYNLLNQ